MIQMICGACRVENTLKRAADGPFSLSPEAEQRMVDAGAAKYITSPPMCVATPGNGEGGGDEYRDEDPPPHYPTGQEIGDDGNITDICEETAEADDVLDIADGHFTVESLMRLTRANMDELAAKLDVNTSKCRNKSEIAGLLAAVNVEDGEDGGDSPDLGAAPPVI